MNGMLQREMSNNTERMKDNREGMLLSYKVIGG
jgi:hypothetical protein